MIKLIILKRVDTEQLSNSNKNEYGTSCRQITPDFYNITCRAVSIETEQTANLSMDEQLYCGEMTDSFLFKQRFQVCLTLREILNLPNVPIHKMPNGKPYLNNRKESLTIAHKDQIVFVCVHHDGLTIGADVEDEHQNRNWGPFQGRFFNHQDWLLSLRLSQQFSLNTDTSMLILFTAKEALLKCTELEIDALKMILNLEINKSSAQNIILTANLEWRNSLMQFSIEIIRQNNYIFAICTTKQ